MPSKKKPGYLLIHSSGYMATVDTIKPIDGLTAIINLNTLEQYVGGSQWEKIPSGYDELLNAEEAFMEDEYINENELLPEIQQGARRVYSPEVVWAYAKARFK